MCRVDYGDRSLMLGDESPVARKAHRCGECRREILPGETYRRMRLISDGSASTEKFCMHCNVAAEWLVGECSGYIFTKVLDDLEEHQHESGGAYPELQPLIDGMRAKWRGPDGVLVAIPAMPPLSHQSSSGGAQHE